MSMNSNYKTDNGEVVSALSKVKIHYSDSWEVKGYRERSNANYAQPEKDEPLNFVTVDPNMKIFHQIKFKGKSLAQYLNSVHKLLASVKVVRYSHYADPHYLSGPNREEYERYMRASISRGLGETIANKVEAVEIRAETHKDESLARIAEKAASPADLHMLAYGEQVRITAECIVLPVAHYEELLQTVRALTAIVTNTGTPN